MNKRLLSAGLLVGVLSACMTKRSHYDTPEVPLPASLRNTAKVAEDPLRKVSPLKSVLPDWWRLLGNPELNELVDRALANNHELRIATNRITQASRRVEQARADQLPAFSLPYSAATNAPTEGVGLLPTGGEFTSRRTYQASVRAEWRPDLWGEVKAIYETAELQLWRATYARDDVQRALTANIVSLYSNYLSLCDRLRIAEESETVLSGLLASVRERMNSGDATIIEFEQQRAAVFQVRATIPQLQLQRDQVKNRLASLAGTVPGALHLSERGLDSLSYPVVATGLPSALLLRRPDVRVVEATMLAADANIDTARARVFPQMDISAQYGVGGFALSQLIQPARIFWSGIASLTTSIFDYGKRSNEVAIARSVHEELLESYVQTLYNAVREVEDAQAGIASNSKRLAIQQESVAAALSAWTYSRESYEAGAIDYMVLLDTERSYHARLDELNRIRLEHCLALVELFQSLGGGVDTTASIPGSGKRPPDPPEVNVGLVQSSYQLERASTVFGPAKLAGGEGKQWLVELPGVASYGSVMAMRRDLYARFPDLMTRQRIVLVRQDGRIADELNRERTSWYRLFVGSFADPQASEQFCAVLRTQFMRCNSLLNGSSAFAGGGKWLQLGDAPLAAGQAQPMQAAAEQAQLVQQLVAQAQPALKAAEQARPLPVAPAVPATPLPVAAAAIAVPKRAEAPEPEPAKTAPPAAMPAPATDAPGSEAALAFRLKLSHQITLPTIQPAPAPVQPALARAAPAKPPAVKLVPVAPVARAIPVLPTIGMQAFTPSMSVAAAAPASVRPAYSVQVYSLQYAGRFTPDVINGLKKRFERSLASWKERGYTPFLYRTEQADANIEISICIGAFDSLDGAADLAQQIKEGGQLVAVIVPVELQDGRPMPLDAHLQRAATAQATTAAARSPLPRAATMIGTGQ
jgi:multidrug efflux system outer membrane protein